MFGRYTVDRFWCKGGHGRDNVLVTVGVVDTGSVVVGVSDAGTIVAVSGSVAVGVSDAEVDVAVVCT
jgi:hypothetical protein